MSTNKFTLDDIKAAAEKKYGSFDIEIVEGENVSLLNPMRMDKSKRSQLGELQKRLDELKDISEEDAEEIDEEAIIEEMLTLVCATEGQAKKLLKALGGDLAVKLEIFNQYGEFTQAGEASASQD